MLVKCPVCEAHVPTQIAVEVEAAGEVQRFCSARCAEEAAPKTGSLPELPPLPRRILVAMDGSGPSQRALELAASLARAGGGELCLLAAVDDRLLRAFDLVSGTSRAFDLGVKPDEIERMLREEAAAQLERGARLCREAGIAYTTRVELRPPLAAIVDAAEQADLVVMGSRGLGAISGAVLGSLSHRVMAAVSTPVLVAH
jgi:nucleotide-binding universal stress UspA family protein